MFSVLLFEIDILPRLKAGIPTAVGGALPTRFGGFVLLITLPHCSLHTRCGHVLP